MTKARGRVHRKGSEEVKLHWRDNLDAVQHHGDHIVISRNGRDAAVLVPLDWHEQAAAALNRETGR